MRKIIFLFAFFTVPVYPIYSQMIKIENGIVISSMGHNKLNLFEKNIYTYSIAAGIDYFEHKYVYLSSKIGYLKKGGKNEVFLVSEIIDELTNKISIFENWNFIDVNTTCRLKYPLNNSHIYIGFGPFTDFLIGSNNTHYLESYKANKILFGICSELGFNRYLTDKMMLGVNISHQTLLNNFVHSNNSKIKNKTFYFMFTFGYSLY
ncbi:MAG: hypothetical protein LBF08_06000 [Dysgonamonadaceae bacterium]|jgi:hypothetical protein|nr:hypothetical protein [Dysgonamonadaceae bacterium]